ncbi:MAG: helix-turn-helix domain-containing protein [Bacteroides sp.]|nr:helix-turn-helix domain-containing protein [Bacteroides sp.]MCM1389449.1 helix-turn-helix domain-containing protein [Bacteroides sp.]
MDIPSRIKLFLDSTGIQNSQFADTCGIPRPSLSQLLNGRNKKVSDEVIGKIHDAYPNLSVLWLLFGEGDMLNSGNIETSERQNEDLSPISPFQNADIEDVKLNETDFSSVNKKDANRNFPNNTAEFSFPTEEIPVQRISPAAHDAHAPQISIKADNARRVTSIMVFYSDNSFETFVPQNKKSI